MTARGMRNLSLVAMLLLGVGGLVACGRVDPGPTTTQTRDVAAIDAVELRSSGNLSITRGDATSLTITAGANQLKDITSEVQAGRLTLDSRGGGFFGGGDISFALVVPSLTAITVSGSGDVVGDQVTGDQPRVEVSGSGNARLTGLDASSTEVTLSGSGDLTLNGTADMQRVDISGSGEYDGDGLTTRETTASVGGSGSAHVRATERLSASVSGSGAITYSGNPAQVSRDVSGSGEIEPA